MVIVFEIWQQPELWSVERSEVVALSLGQVSDVRGRASGRDDRVGIPSNHHGRLVGFEVDRRLSVRAVRRY